MHSVLKRNISYKSTIIFMSAMTVILGFGCMLLGYLFLPFASAFYALLIWYERSEKRVLTYVIPVVLFVINFFLNGLFSLEAVAYVALGLVIYFSYKRGISKGEAVFYAILLSLILLSVSMLFLAFNAKGSVSADAITGYYSEIFSLYKSQFSDIVTSIVTVTEDGILHYAYNLHEAELLFHEIVILCIPTLIITVFLLVGIAFKIFSFNVRKYSADEKKINSWNFGVSNAVAYFYVAISVLSIFTSGFDGVFPMSVATIDSVLCAVLAYIGFAFVYNLISLRRSPIFAVMAIVIASIIFSSAAFKVLSFIGVYYTIAANRVIKSRGK